MRTRRLTRRYGSDGQDDASITIEYLAAGRDADAFDRAFETNDLDALVGLLKSDEAVARLGEPKHPWAEDACTIGALCAMQIALLSSVAAKDDPGLKAEIGKAGAVTELTVLLGSEQQDRVQAAVVALNYLTMDCSLNAHSAVTEGAMPMLIALLGAPLKAMRGAVASTLRNLCMESEEYCRTFMRLGGIRGFVQQLDVVSDPYLANDPWLDPADLALEAVWNLEEVTTDGRGAPIPEWVQLAVEAGALEKLPRLCSSDNEEVSAAAQKALDLFKRAHELAAAEPTEL